MTDYDCLCLGVIVVDHLCTPIPRMPRPGELVLARDLPLSIGGLAANAAIDLAKQDYRVAIAGAIGQDLFGDFALQTLAAANVQTAPLRRLPDVATSGTLILNIEGEDRRFIHTRGANALVKADDLPANLPASCRVLYIGGFLLMPELERQDQFRQHLQKLRQQGVKIVLDVVVPGTGNAGELAYWPSFEHILPVVDYFLPNSDEAELITGLTDPAAQAEKFLSAGAGTVVITLGAQGTYAASRSERLRGGCYPMEYVGGTGSGDAFDAGFIAGLLRGEDLRGCIRWGSVLGASCVRALSATDGVFTRVEAEEFLARHELPLTNC
ncbi:MAG: carbohydrate kinase family protein [Pirellulales bacterium]|nr:carbohydrate kinase family protein [Pirellulales bacterium]